MGGGIIQMSGSIGGNTFARNRSGNYVRAKTKPTNPNTALQQAVRASIASLTSTWGAVLTDAQRIAWNLYASNVSMKNRLGEDIFLTGFNHFIRSNAIREAHGIAIIAAGPTTFELPAQDPTFAATASEATQEISIAFDIASAWAVEDGGYLFVFQGSPQNAQRNFFAGPWRFIDSEEGADPGPIVSPLVSAAVFAIADGQRTWFYGRIQRADGRQSEPFREGTFIAL